MPAEGLLLIRKPSGVTSHDAVVLVRRKLAIQRIGHTGTLDPMAEGLLILLVGRATRHQQAFQLHDKLYEAVLQFGTQTDTGDRTGQPLCTAPVPALNDELIRDALNATEGPMLQTPPAYSAVKVRGRPAYWWARRQQSVSLAPRPIHVHAITLIGWGAQTLTVQVSCSAGTYIRSLAELIAQRLGTVGHLSALVRLRIGDWHVDDAASCDWIAQADADAINRRVLPIPSAV